MTSPDRRLLTNALVLILENSTSRSIGDHETPENIPSGEPWAIVYAIPGGNFDGPPLRAPNADGSFVYQVTSAGRSREQAEWMADMVRRTLLARNADGSFQVEFPDTTPLQVYARDSDSIGGVTVEGLPTARVFSVADRFTLFVTPA